MTFYYVCPACQTRHKKDTYCIAQQASPWATDETIKHKCQCGSENAVPIDAEEKGFVRETRK